MHELSIAQALFEQVQSITAHENSRVMMIAVSIGTLSGVDSEALDQAFRITVDDTPLKDAKLQIEKVPARVICHSCNRESSPAFPFFACQYCNSFDFEIVSGRDLLLKSIELESSSS
ncbi:MAG: hydrogenase maturation nickel metallochaperone HypA [Kiritimatiellae bacterium]|nr:hydrogenase maturation nickel metallochaperone HypA [Kiritimatiellia bacterium]MDD5523171.1 hydrogenase maturation nickel metallochaperone HypA [Kiritimatiellia bacterium]